MSKSSLFDITRSITLAEALLGMMACLSIIVVIMPKDWASKTYEFRPSDYSATLSDDRFAGGASIASWRNKDAQHWHCEMQPKHRTPFCSMTISVLDENWRGLDLREYNELTIYGNYQGDGQYIRLYLRNRHPAYFVTGDDTTTKYNMVEIPVSDLANGLSIKMKDFGVADWWLTTKNIPLKNSHPEFNDIVFVELQTGSQSRTGSHSIQLKKIEWRGNLISDEMLYKAVVIGWTVIIFAILLYRVISLRLELTRNQRYQTELIAINKFLNLQNKQFEDLAKTDQLTGLCNRMGIRDALYESLQNWKEHRTPFSFVLIDIDHFKSVNDTYGHDTGDKILKAAATLFKENVRRTDFLARWGGEEFILVCPNTDIDQAKATAELLRQKLEETKVHDELSITASFGVATMTQPDLDVMFKTADEALYDAKKQGRNVVLCRH